ncbi:MAG: hypothetical protein KKD17_05790 [Nanoarchaeota archaeon]|nr:hypothetical protein [Nanoarchaeota archaeon]
MPEPLKLTPNKAAELVLEDILKDDSKKEAAIFATKTTAGISLRDSSDPEYTTGNVVLNMVYETPLEGMNEMKAAFETKLYAPLGFIMHGIESVEEYERLDEYERFFAQSMQMIQHLGRLARAVFIDGVTIEEACERYRSRGEPPKDMKEPGYVTATGEEAVSLETREVQTPPGGRPSAKEDPVSCETRVLDTNEKEP